MKGHTLAEAIEIATLYPALEQAFRELDALPKSIDQKKGVPEYDRWRALAMRYVELMPSDVSCRLCGREKSH